MNFRDKIYSTAYLKPISFKTNFMHDTLDVWCMLEHLTKKPTPNKLGDFGRNYLPIKGQLDRYEFSFQAAQSQ